MQFNSVHFLIFFPIVVFLYFSLKHKYRWILLLIASYYFYMSWRAEYIILIIVSTLVDYIAGLQIHKSEDKRRKKLFLWMSLIVNLGLLFTFKYWNFFTDSLRQLLAHFAIPLSPMTINVLLPVGISFYTFQTMSYTIDVYYGKIKPERHLGIFALYVSFFPQLVAGPIERAKHLIPQLKTKHNFDYARVVDGLKLMLWGMFKKVVIADKLAIIVNTVFGIPEAYSGSALILAAVFFTFQIYCDFSGYTDIALGAARVMGIDIMDNFNLPFKAKSIAEYWRRWHISLSTWFQDYVFNPLYLSVSKWKLWRGLSDYRQHFFAFSISIVVGLTLLGVWHGAGWNYVVFGLYHGIFVALYYLTRKWWDRMPGPIRQALTFAIVVISLIIFRAHRLADSWYIITHLFANLSWNVSFGELGFGFFGIAYHFALIVLIGIVHKVQRIEKWRTMYSKTPTAFRWGVALMAVLMILFLGSYENISFIYFQF